jgi:N-acyl homoserine lactone hydrolase
MLHRLIVIACALALSACSTRLSTHRVTPSDLGAPATEARIVESMAQPGLVTFEKIVAADWHFPNTTRPPGAAEWQIRQLDAQIYFYAIRHPRFGLYFIDAGMPADYEAHMGPILRGVVRNDYGFQLRTATEAWVREHEAPRGVFVTHLHYDHVLGVAPLDRDIPVYVGPRDGAQANFLYRFINQPTREALAGRTVHEWRFASPRRDQLAAIDVFGDGSVFALHVPGHTPGSTAYLVNATTGPQLITGDAVHSREAWTGELEEATGFEADLPQIFASRAALQALAVRIPRIAVHPGHQSLAAAQ